MEWKDLKIEPNYEKILPKLTGEEREALKASIVKNSLLMPLIVNSKGTILDGHNRYGIAKELGFKPILKIEVKDFTDPLEEEAFVISINLQRRNLKDFQKAEMGMALLEVETKLAKARQEIALKGPREERKGRTLPSNEGDVGEATGVVSKKIGLSKATFERAKKVIEEGPENLKEMCRTGTVTINAGYGLTKAFDEVPKDAQEKLVDKVKTGTLDPRQAIQAIANTKAVKAKLEGEDPEIQEKAEELFKDAYYTEGLDAKTAIYSIEEIAGDSHALITREFPMDKFTSEEEAQEWAVARGGVCLGKIEKWSIKYDPVKDKKLEEEDQ